MGSGTRPFIKAYPEKNDKETFSCLSSQPKQFYIVHNSNYSGMDEPPCFRSYCVKYVIFKGLKILLIPWNWNPGRAMIMGFIFSQFNNNASIHRRRVYIRFILFLILSPPSLVSVKFQ